MISLSPDSATVESPVFGLTGLDLKLEKVIKEFTSFYELDSDRIDVFDKESLCYTFFQVESLLLKLSGMQQGKNAALNWEEEATVFTDLKKKVSQLSDSVDKCMNADIVFLEERIEDIRQGRWRSALKSLQSILPSLFHAASDAPLLSKAINNEAVEFLECDFSRGSKPTDFHKYQSGLRSIGLLAAGIVACQIFVQANFTGPPFRVVRPSELAVQEQEAEGRERHPDHPLYKPGAGNHSQPKCLCCCRFCDDVCSKECAIVGCQLAATTGEPDEEATESCKRLLGLDESFETEGEEVYDRACGLPYLWLFRQILVVLRNRNVSTMKEKLRQNLGSFDTLDCLDIVPLTLLFVWESRERMLSHRILRKCASSSGSIRASIAPRLVSDVILSLTRPLKAAGIIPKSFNPFSTHAKDFEFLMKAMDLDEVLTGTAAQTDRQRKREAFFNDTKGILDGVDSQVCVIKLEAEKAEQALLGIPKRPNGALDVESAFWFPHSAMMIPRLQTSILLELTLRLAFYGRIKAFEIVCELACSRLGVAFELTGAAGIRRKHQVVEIPQLIVRASYLEHAKDITNSKKAKDEEGIWVKYDRPLYHTCIGHGAGDNVVASKKEDENEKNLCVHSGARRQEDEEVDDAEHKRRFWTLDHLNEDNDILEAPAISDKKELNFYKRPLSLLEQELLLARCRHVLENNPSRDELALEEIGAIVSRALVLPSSDPTKSKSDKIAKDAKAEMLAASLGKESKWISGKCSYGDIDWKVVRLLAVILEKVEDNTIRAELIRAMPAECFSHLIGQECESSLISADWLVFSTGLWFRCKTEFHRCKTVERACLQLHALVDQFSDSDPPVSRRVGSFFTVEYPSLWELKRELAKHMMSVGATITASTMYEDLHMWEEAADCLVAADRRADARTLINEKLKIRPSPDLWCTLGDLERSQCRAKAVECYEAAWTLSKNKSFRSQRSLGHLLMAEGNVTGAVECYKRATNIISMSTKTWFALGCCYIRLRNFDKAVSAFGRVVALEPEEGDAWSNLAAIHSERSAWRSAFICAHEAVKYRRESWKVWDNLMMISAKLGDTQNVANAAKMFIHLNAKQYLPTWVFRFLEEVTLEKLVDDECSNETSGETNHISKAYLLQNSLEALEFLSQSISDSPPLFQALSSLQSKSGENFKAFETSLKEFRAWQAIESRHESSTTEERLALAKDMAKSIRRAIDFINKDEGLLPVERKGHIGVLLDAVTSQQRRLQVDEGQNEACILEGFPE